MNNSIRHQLNQAIDELSELYPDWRYGQLLTNIALWAKGPSETAAWDATDEELLTAAREHIHSRRSESGSSRKTA